MLKKYFIKDFEFKDELDEKITNFLNQKENLINDNFVGMISALD